MSVTVTISLWSLAALMALVWWNFGMYGVTIVLAFYGAVILGGGSISAVLGYFMMKVDNAKS